MQHIAYQRGILRALYQRAEFQLAAAVECYPAVDDLALFLTFFELVREVYRLGESSREIEVEYEPERENVRFFGYFLAYLLAVVLAVGVLAELGGVVVYRADYLVGLLVYEVAAVEVDELGDVISRSIAHEQHVFEFEVAVDNALAVDAEQSSRGGLHEELLYVHGEAREDAFCLVVVDSTVDELSRLDVLVALDELIAGDDDISARARYRAYRLIDALAGVDEVVEQLLVVLEGLGIESAVVYGRNGRLILFQEVFLACSCSSGSLTALAVFPVGHEFISVESHACSPPIYLV